MQLRYIGKYESTPHVGIFHSPIIHPNEVRDFPDDIALILLGLNEYELATEDEKPFVHPHEEMQALLEQRQQEAAAHAEQLLKGMQQ